MKLRSLNELSKLVQRNDFFDFLSKEMVDWDIALDQRDSGSIDKLWIDQNNELKKHDYPTSSDEGDITKLREYSFKAVFKETNNSDLASYISDDIGLLGEAMCKGKMTEWLDSLLESYMLGKFPC